MIVRKDSVWKPRAETAKVKTVQRLSLPLFFGRGGVTHTSIHRREETLYPVSHTFSFFIPALYDSRP